MSGSGRSVLLRHLPNIFTSPSEASKKETVSTPSLVTGTSANDCMFKEISKEMVNEIGSCHLDCFEVWRYCGHLLFLCLRRRLLSRDSRPHGSLVASRGVFGAGTPGERRTFLIRSVAKVIRSDRQRLALSDSLVGQVSQAFLCTSPFAHGTSIRKRQCSLRSKMVRLWSVISIIHHRQSPLVQITPPSTDRMEITWNEPSRYEVIRRVGGGKYSEVRQFRLPIPPLG